MQKRAQSKQKPEQAMKTYPPNNFTKVGVINAIVTVKIRFTATPMDSPFSVMISVRYIQVRGPKDNSKTTIKILMKTRAT